MDATQMAPFEPFAIINKAWQTMLLRRYKNILPQRMPLKWGFCQLNGLEKAKLTPVIF
jgi:hypothetical protein